MHRSADTGAAVMQFTGPALAKGNEHAVPWQMGLPEPATPVAEFIYSFHQGLLYLITVISLFVLALMIYVMVRFNARANPTPSKTTHNTMIEVLWTVIPILILVGVAIPSFRLLYLQRNIPAADMTIKVIGNPSWNWTYEYPDLGLNDDGSAKVSFTAYLRDEAKDIEKAHAAGVPYLLATDVPVVVPVGKVVRLQITSADVIHSFVLQSFGVRLDAVPGRLNETWFKAEKEGIYFGQCSKICGKDHAFMPIAFRAVSQDKYNQWREEAKKKFAARPSPNEFAENAAR